MAIITSMGWGALLLTNGGIFKCSQSWIQRVCQGLNLRRRAGTTAAQKLPDGYKEVVELLCLQVAYLVYLHGWVGWGRGIWARAARMYTCNSTVHHWQAHQTHVGPCFAGSRPSW